LILFLMAATSHDFWLHNLGAVVWKKLHMLVYVAYALLVAHVALGALQSEPNPLLAGAVVVGVVVVTGLHTWAGMRESVTDSPWVAAERDGFIEVAELESIPDKRAVVRTLGTERVAIFRFDGKVSAVSNVCRHQGGPLGEGKIVDGCITCPWHGYQYLPDTGMSPPPFTDKVPVYRTQIVNGKVYVHPCPISEAR
jgi:methionine sulfoxide reductase heme-binding subunit